MTNNPITEDRKFCSKFGPARKTLAKDAVTIGWQGPQVRSFLIWCSVGDDSLSYALEFPVFKTFFWGGAGIEPRTLSLPGRCGATKHNPPPSVFNFCKTFLTSEAACRCLGRRGLVGEPSEM